MLVDGGLLEAVAAADGRDFQMQGSVLRMAALVEDLKVCCVAGHDADEHIGLVVFAKVGTKSALSILNSFHRNLLHLLYWKARFVTQLPR